MSYAKRAKKTTTTKITPLSVCVRPCVRASKISALGSASATKEWGSSSFLWCLGRERQQLRLQRQPPPPPPQEQQQPASSSPLARILLQPQQQQQQRRRQQRPPERSSGLCLPAASAVAANSAAAASHQRRHCRRRLLDPAAANLTTTTCCMPLLLRARPSSSASRRRADLGPVCGRLTTDRRRRNVRIQPSNRAHACPRTQRVHVLTAAFVSRSCAATSAPAACGAYSEIGGNGGSGSGGEGSGGGKGGGGEGSGRPDVVAGAQDVRDGAQRRLRDALVDGEDGAGAHVAIDVGRAIERVEG